MLPPRGRPCDHGPIAARRTRCERPHHQCPSYRTDTLHNCAPSTPDATGDKVCICLGAHLRRSRRVWRNPATLPGGASYSTVLAPGRPSPWMASHSTAVSCTSSAIRSVEGCSLIFEHGLFVPAVARGSRAEGFGRCAVRCRAVDTEEALALTEENVELVLDEVRRRCGSPHVWVTPRLYPQFARPGLRPFRYHHV